MLLHHADHAYHASRSYLPTKQTNKQKPSISWIQVYFSPFTHQLSENKISTLFLLFLALTFAFLLLMSNELTF